MSMRVERASLQQVKHLAFYICLCNDDQIHRGVWSNLDFFILANRSRTDLKSLRNGNPVTVSLSKVTQLVNCSNRFWIAKFLSRGSTSCKQIWMREY